MRKVHRVSTRAEHIARQEDAAAQWLAAHDVNGREAKRREHRERTARESEAKRRVLDGQQG